jgi:hypothetical protein
MHSAAQLPMQGPPWQAHAPSSSSENSWKEVISSCSQFCSHASGPLAIPGASGGGTGVAPHAPAVHVRPQQSPNVAQWAPISPQPIVPPHVPFMQSLLQQVADVAQISPSGVHVGAVQTFDTQLPLQQSVPVVHIPFACVHEPLGTGATHTPEHEVLQQSVQAVQLAPRALQVIAPPPSRLPIPEGASPLEAAQLKTTRTERPVTPEIRTERRVSMAGTISEAAMSVPRPERGDAAGLLRVRAKEQGVLWSSGRAYR